MRLFFLECLIAVCLPTFDPPPVPPPASAAAIHVNEALSTLAVLSRDIFRQYVGLQVPGGPRHRREKDLRTGEPTQRLYRPVPGCMDVRVPAVRPIEN